MFALAAPVFMKLGWESMGRLIYAIYRNFCHQFAFRSWFLFGQQAYYPLSSTQGLVTYEQMFHRSADDLLAARAILGSEQAGYKIAICQRDLAMYGMLLIFGIIFSTARGRLKRIPLWIWLVMGVLPLALDGFTQLVSIDIHWLPSWTGRESTPLLRTLSGGLFGLLSAWYIFPSLEASDWVASFKKENRTTR